MDQRAGTSRRKKAVAEADGGENAAGRRPPPRPSSRACRTQSAAPRSTRSPSDTTSVSPTAGSNAVGLHRPGPPAEIDHGEAQRLCVEGRDMARDRRGHLSDHRRGGQMGAPILRHVGRAAHFGHHPREPLQRSARSDGPPRSAPRPSVLGLRHSGQRQQRPPRMTVRSWSRGAGLAVAPTARPWRPRPPPALPSAGASGWFMSVISAGRSDSPPRWPCRQGIRPAPGPPSPSS